MYGKKRRASKSLKRLRSVKRKLFGVKKVVSSDVGGQFVRSSSKVVGKKKKLSLSEKVTRIMNPMGVQIEQFSHGVEVKGGLQAVSDITLFGDTGDILDSFTKMRNYTTENPTTGANTSLIPGGSQYQPSTNWPYGATRLQMEFMQSLVTFLNSSRSTLDVSLFLVTPRFNMSQTFADTTARTPSNTWEKALEASQLLLNNDSPVVPLNAYSGSVAPSIYDINQSPDNKSVSYNFGKFYKIVKKESFKLEPGQMKKCFYRVNGPRNVDYSIITDPGCWMRPGWCYQLLVVVKGQLVNFTSINNNVNPPVPFVDFGDVTTSFGQLSWTISKKVGYRLKKAQQDKVYQTTYLARTTDANHPGDQFDDADVKSENQQVFVKDYTVHNYAQNN